MPIFDERDSSPLPFRGGALWVEIIGIWYQHFGIRQVSAAPDHAAMDACKPHAQNNQKNFGFRP